MVRAALDGTSAIETPSGRGAKHENFPVASWLLPARLRRHARLFYAYARAIDDIADDPDLPAADKIARLDGFAAAVAGDPGPGPAFAKAVDMRRSLAETGVTERHCIDLTLAFKRDAAGRRYGSWDELMGYCDLSAAPVGRYLVDLHGESRTLYPASDALCNALQVLDHLQDCGGDWRALGRLYLPLEWMSEAGVGAGALGADRATPALRGVLDRCLDAASDLLEAARDLPLRVRSPRLAMEAAATLAVARRLAGELGRRDPLAERVVLRRPRFAACCAGGALRGALSRLPRPGAASGR